MFRGLYMASSSLITNNKKIDIVSNNISNINTTAFKKDLVIIESFEDALISKMDGSITPGNLRKQHKVEVKNEDNYFEVKSKTGYMRVQTPTGISFHNKARFTVGEDGFLRTFYRNGEGKIESGYGYQILGNNGPIYIGNGQVNIDEGGRVFVDGELRDSLITFTHPSVIGTMNSGVKLERVETDFTQGHMIRTGNPLDLAIKGSGFFKIETDEGTRYTRDGSFKLNANKELITSEGHKVQGSYGDIIIDGEEISITPQGEIMVDGEVVDRLDIVNIKNIRDLRKIEGGLYKIEDGIEVENGIFDGQVFQGQLEKSNVDSIKEMIEMMTLYRGYESSQKIIKAYDETIGKAVNEVGKV
ncbi:flagellar hook-basal body protein [Paramaledivibacter caminithermalis]|uniref:Flagellar basal-body rod protein FlgG n=1 Tax=Paramaledivibacter caminithermalis (strain DSM 15212 / CIP 107654 / DViRD3) TaxID=1121301 RepID=A0A1M6L437_PARC5|nr:flagellar hook-basal body complex protein [Paramaledivibacter caminithermalis]SHJ65952.1 flagellar basal-body rod protein FlgG [Paramaledivibacter caminithermalis DSM 15212]